jgi:hypothetical protein
MAGNDVQMASGNMSDSNDEATRKTIRRTAIGLGLIAAAVYFGFMALRLL